MFCSKCGNELKNGEQFCPNCGTKSGASGNPIKINVSTEEIKGKAVELKNNFFSSVTDLGKNKALILGNMALLILSLILSVTEVFKVGGILGISESMSMFQDMAGVRVFFIICYLISVLALVFPMLLKKAWKPKFFLPSKIVTILSIIWFFIVLLTGLDQVNSSELSSMAEFSLSVTGWLFLVTTVSALILAYKNSFDFKNKKVIVENTAEEAAPENT